MSEFHKEVGTLFGLSEQQSERLEQGLNQLEQEFAVASNIEDHTFSADYYQKFTQLVMQSGLTEDDIEPLVNVLYFSDDHQQVATYIVPSYYNSGGDRAVFSDTYQLMMEELQQSM